jgi:hypothetical protein
MSAVLTGILAAILTGEAAILAAVIMVIPEA